MRNQKQRTMEVDYFDNAGWLAFATKPGNTVFRCPSRPPVGVSCGLNGAIGAPVDNTRDCFHHHSYEQNAEYTLRLGESGIY